MNENSDIPRILVIDDEQSMCELIETDLRLRGLHVDWFTDATQAISAIDQNNYDVVLTDIRSPDDGLWEPGNRSLCHAGGSL